ncbi:MAG: iron ABC transporter ATP-binding protein [Chloroflexi bacterium]|nr:MAG: iron ABC transporter ATP-binding protein [Chloroflexota bacterium]
MLQLIDVTKHYNGTPALISVNLTVAEGEIVCLLGPSGCGKTTLLRAVAGLEQPNAGQVLLHGEDLAQVPVHRRNFGLMFQEFALFPHRSVGENIAFGLRMGVAGKQWTPAAIAQRVEQMLALVDLAGYGGRSVFALSGGERQRVALARSLAPHPRLLMLDEPLGSLDRALREELMVELRTILKQVGVTALYVTHDQEEAYAVADRLVVMNRGRLEQVGTPQAVYGHPANEFVARFLGFQNLVPATVDPAQPGLLHTPVGQFVLEGEPAQGQTLLIRPQAVRAFRAVNDDGPAVNQIVGRLESFLFRGSHYRIELAVEGANGDQHLVFELPMAPNRPSTPPAPGSWVTLTLDPAYLALI